MQKQLHLEILISAIYFKNISLFKHTIKINKKNGNSSSIQ